MTQIQMLIQDLFTHLAARALDKPNPASLAKSIIIEAAELLEHFQWSEPDINIIKNDKFKQQKMESTAQKYPADLVKNSSERYWQLKRKSRESKSEGSI